MLTCILDPQLLSQLYFTMNNHLLMLLVTFIVKMKTSIPYITLNCEFHKNITE